MKRIYATLAGLCLLATTQVQASAPSNVNLGAHTGVKTNATTSTMNNGQTAEQTLENELRQYIADHPEPAASANQAFNSANYQIRANWLASAKALGHMPMQKPNLVETDQNLPACVGTQTVIFADRYVMVTDAKSQPCKIYDLSFPTLASVLGFKTVAKLPVQKFVAQDYLNWMHGDYEAVYKGIKDFQTGFKTSDPASNPIQDSWVSQLKFRPSRLANLKWKTLVGNTVIPTGFKASDLEIGSDFSFSDDERASLHDMVNAMRADNPSQFTADDEAAWTDLIDHPETVLDKVHFVWNDLEKVYDIVMDGSFLPITGPVALVDLEKPYRPAMQAMVRSILESAVLKIVEFIPDPTSQRVISVVLNDVFGFVDNMYEYQMNLMEPALRDAQAGATLDANLVASYDKGIDNLFATRNGFFTDYIMAIAQGKQFDWSKIQKIGHAARYKAEKARDISMNNVNSNLALKSGCDTQMFYNYFAVCSKKGAMEGVYSLLSETTVLFWNLGAPLTYRPSFPAEVVLKRATSRILASGLLIVRLPILDFLTDKLAEELKNYAMSGLMDEAFLRAELMNEKHTHGSLDAQKADIMKWLYIQNINPFMPKSESSEASIIQKTHVEPSPLQGNN